MMKEPGIGLRFISFLHLKAVIFGICILNVVVSAMYVRRVDFEAQAAFAAGRWGYTEHRSPSAYLEIPIILLVAAMGLLINRWWSVLIAMLVSIRVVYALAYLPLVAVHGAHDVPMFSLQALDIMWLITYRPHPQYLFEVVISATILIYGITLLVRKAFSRFEVSLASR